MSLAEELAVELAVRYPISYRAARQYVALAEAAGNLELARVLCDMDAAESGVGGVVYFLLQQPDIAGRYWAGVAGRAVGAR